MSIKPPLRKVIAVSFGELPPKLCQIVRLPWHTPWACWSCFWHFVVVAVEEVVMAKLGVCGSETDNRGGRSLRLCEKVCIKFPFPLIVWWAGPAPHALILGGLGSLSKGVSHTSQAPKLSLLIPTQTAHLYGKVAIEVNKPFLIPTETWTIQSVVECVYVWHTERWNKSWADEMMKDTKAALRMYGLWELEFVLFFILYVLLLPDSF